METEALRIPEYPVALRLLEREVRRTRERLSSAEQALTRIEGLLRDYVGDEDVLALAIDGAICARRLNLRPLVAG